MKHTERGMRNSSPSSTVDSGYFSIPRETHSIPVIHEKSVKPSETMTSRDGGCGGHVYRVRPGQPQIIRLGGGRDVDLSGYCSDSEVTASPHVLKMLPRGATVVYGGGGDGYTRQVSYGSEDDVHGANSAKVYQTPGGSMIKITSPTPGNGHGGMSRYKMRRGGSIDDLLSGSRVYSPAICSSANYSDPFHREPAPHCSQTNRVNYGRSRSTERILEEDEQRQTITYRQLPLQTQSVHHTLVDDTQHAGQASGLPKLNILHKNVSGFHQTGTIFT